MKQTAGTAPGTAKLRSLQAVLAWRLGGVLVVSMSLVIITVLSYFWIALDDLDDASLQIQAQQIAVNLEAKNGQLTLNLPEALQEIYDASGNGFLYVIQDAAGRVALASSDKARQLIGPASLNRDLPFFFRLANTDGGKNPYYGLAVGLPNFPGHRLFVAQGQIHKDVLFDTMLTEFGGHIAWTLPMILLSALAIAIWTIRSSLAPLAEISRRVGRIGPHNTDIRLPVTDIPKEIRSLVEAVNDALARLEQGFLIQRQFTANAAHELRTPLAILNARLDELDDSETAASLAIDIRRMNRLVEQLLRVSRLDAGELPIDEDVDLNAVASEIVAYLAPLAIGEGLTLSLSPSAKPVIARGNAAALSDALRNLIENAMQHSPRGGDVLIEVAPSGTITVNDQGKGIDEADKQHIFQRFWRGRSRSGTGSGLGLAIVSETAHAHGGTIAVDNNPNGGASFRLSLPLKP